MSPVNVGAIGAYIREQREQAKISLRQLAQSAVISNPYLSQIERGLRKPSAEVLNQIAKALRVSAEVLYVQAGMLEPGAKSEVRDAIVTDTAITERHALEMGVVNDGRLSIVFGCRGQQGRYAHRRLLAGRIL